MCEVSTALPLLLQVVILCRKIKSHESVRIGGGKDGSWALARAGDKYDVYLIAALQVGADGDVDDEPIALTLTTCHSPQYICNMFFFAIRTEGSGLSFLHCRFITDGASRALNI